jgi:mercuric ion transport protein
MSDLKKSNAQKGTGFLVAGILSAIGASICCVGPLVLLALGISGAWIGSLTVLEPYRPSILKRQRLAFWIVTVLVLGLIAVPWVAPIFY